MQDTDIQRLQVIGKRRWLRHFDNRLGICHRHGILGHFRLKGFNLQSRQTD